MNRERRKVEFYKGNSTPFAKRVFLTLNFWNAASFGEMEPGIVKNYAKYISSFSANLFLMQHFSGKHGPKLSVTMPVYETAFSSYELIALAQSTRADTVTPMFEDDDFYHNTFWERKP